MARFGQKLPYEKYFISFDFTALLPAGATILTATVTALDPDDVDVTASLTEVGRQVITSPKVYVYVQGGVAGTEYAITCQVTTNAPSQHQIDGILPVVETITCGYCATTDMAKLLPATMLVNLSNDIAGSTAVNQTNIDEAIDQADREIDSYLILVPGITVPMDPVPPLVANLSAKMAIWNLHLRKYFDSPVWRKTYEDCQALLLKIAQGKLSLQLDPSVASSNPTSIHAVSTRTQKFTEDFMETF